MVKCCKFIGGVMQAKIERVGRAKMPIMFHKCPLCKKIFKKKFDLGQHLRSHGLPKREINRYLKHFHKS